MVRKVLLKLGILILIPILLVAGDQTKFLGNLYIEDSLRTSVIRVIDSIRIKNLEITGQQYIGNDIDTLACRARLVINKSGAAIYRGDIAIYDSILFAIDTVLKADAVKSASSFACSLSIEGTPIALKMIVIGTADAGDSIRIFGNSYNGGVVRESRYMGTGAASEFWSSYLWSSVDSVQTRGADGASLTGVSFWGSSLGSVRVCASANSERIAGVVLSDSLIDNGTGYIATEGICLADAEPSATAGLGGIKCGDPLVVNSRGNVTETATSDSTFRSRLLGYALQGISAGGTNSVVDSGLIWIYIKSR